MKTSKTPTPDLIEKEVYFRTETRIESPSIDGTDFLRAKKVLRLVQLTQKLDASTKAKIGSPVKKPLKENVEHLAFHLVRTSPKKIRARRNKNLPTFVLKKGEQLYMAKIPKALKLNSQEFFDSHQCRQDCNRITSPPICKKIKYGAANLENYSFIKAGCETFGTDSDSFVVFGCSCYEKCPARCKKSKEEIQEAYANLELFSCKSPQKVTLEFFKVKNLFDY